MLNNIGLVAKAGSSGKTTLLRTSVTLKEILPPGSPLNIVQNFSLGVNWHNSVGVLLDAKRFRCQNHILTAILAYVRANMTVLYRRGPKCSNEERLHEVRISYQGPF